MGEREGSVMRKCVSDTGLPRNRRTKRATRARKARRGRCTSSGVWPIATNDNEELRDEKFGVAEGQ